MPKSGKVTTLEQWFSISAKKPMRLVALLAILLSGIHLYENFKSQAEQQRLSINDIANSVSLALSQNNRILAEATLNASRWGIGSESSTLCQAGNPIISTRKDLDVSCEEVSTRFGFRSIRREIPGFSETKLILVVPIFSDASSLFISFLVAALILTFCFFLINKIQRRLSLELIKPLAEGLISEQPIPIKELEDVRLAQKAITLLRVDAAVKEALIQRDEQIAHDLASPLTAIKVFIDYADGLQELDRANIKGSIDRIEKITRLLSDSSRIAPLQSDFLKVNTSALISKEITEVIESKKIEFKRSPLLTINFSDSTDTQCFAFVDPLEFQRALSNLINNAAEACKFEGRVSVSISQTGNNLLVIKIRDWGPGIPADVLPLLARRGESHGKSGGSGLGLFHARKSFESWGGSLTIESEEGAGTTISLELPFVSQ